MVNKSHVVEPRKKFADQLQECVKSESIVEVILKDTDGEQLTGQISVIGADYIGVTSGSERTITKVSVGQDGKEEKQEFIEVYHLESFIKFEDIKIVSRVLKKAMK